MPSILKELADLFGAAVRTAAGLALLAALYIAAAAAMYFPRHVGDSSASADAGGFYQEAYSASSEEPAPDAEAEARYVEVARRASDATGMTAAVRAFVAEHDLGSKRLLEVGAGSGYFQDVVDDYTGLDIAESARRYFHKPFVQGSATDLPFDDNEFDAAMTVFVLEHIPDPERALEEMRRVLKPGGLLLLAPAWNCPPWLAEGYEVRPYSDFGPGGKLAKASLAVRANPLYRASHLMSVRLARGTAWTAMGGETRLRYTPLRANFDEYWQADSDAVAAIDSYEAMLWFLSRGDACLNCPEGFWDRLNIGFIVEPLIIRVQKPANGQSMRS